LIKALETDPDFSKDEPIQGTHYPCTRDQSAAFWNLKPAKTYWANEDFSTIGGDWAGASCWGRSLTQNFVKLNATSTISWSTIWSVYDSWRYFGNGLMYAFEPWSGNYTVPPTIWTSAHVTQFSAPGWFYLGGITNIDRGNGSGLLPNGGSWTTMVPPNEAQAIRVPQHLRNGRRTVAEAKSGDFSLIIEKLEGRCLRCSVGVTKAESVIFRLTGVLAGTTSLAQWLTNSTHSFVHLKDIQVSSTHEFTLFVPRDTIITVTTTTGQRKGKSVMPPHAYAPFPFPYVTNYDSEELHKPAKYHADNSGAFEVRADQAAPSGGKHLFQASPLYPSGTEWARNFDPITSLGATDWSNYRVHVRVLIQATRNHQHTHKPSPLPGSDPIASGPYGGVCVRVIDQMNCGFCLLVGDGLVVSGTNAPGYSWVVQAGDGGQKSSLSRSVGHVLQHGNMPSGFDPKVWHNLSLSVQGQRLVALVDGKEVTNITSTASWPPSVGLAALRSGFHYAQFDDLTIDGPDSGSFPNSLFVKHLLWPSKAAPGGPVQIAQARTDFTGQVGCTFNIHPNVTQPLIVTALGRFAAGFVSKGKHTLSLYHARTKKTLAQVVIDLAKVQGGDLNGYAWATLSTPMKLEASGTYYLMSSETKGGDTFFDMPQVQALPNVLIGYATSAFETNGQWQHGSMDLDASLYQWASVISQLSGKCLDRAGNPGEVGTRIDTWDCVEDHHNELFSYIPSSGHILVRSDPSTVPPLCVTLGPCPATTKWPPSICEALCIDDSKNQTFIYSAKDMTIRLRQDKNTCLQTTATPSQDAGVTPAPCESTPEKAQQWQFVPYTPPPPPPPERGTCFGPLNIKFKLD